MLDEVVPAFLRTDGDQGWWLVDRGDRRADAVLVCGGDEELQAALEQAQEARAKDPDRHRAAPSHVQRFEIYDQTAVC